jgi:dedicator of cytokinesis protein 3
VGEVARPSPPLPSLKTGDETIAGLEEPLVDEIACELRVSASSMYAHLLRRDYKKYREVKAATEYLHLGRRQLLNANLSTDELQRLRQDLVDRLVQSSIQQGSDIVVRHPLYGALADVDAHEQVDERAWMSGVRMYKLGVELAYTDPATGKRPTGSTSILGASTHIQSPQGVQVSENDTKGTASLSALPIFYHIYIDLKAFVASACTLGETAELMFSLYNKSEKRFLTEEFCIILNHQGGKS